MPTLHNFLKRRQSKFENIERELGLDIIKDKVIYAIDMLKNNSMTRPTSSADS